MTLEEMIKVVTPDAHIGGICLDTKECLQVIAALKAGRTLKHVLEHAIELEHLGQGSTQGWAKKAIAEYNKATQENT